MEERGAYTAELAGNGGTSMSLGGEDRGRRGVVPRCEERKLQM